MKCQLCGKNRNQGNHRKCSKKLQKIYAPGTALHAEQVATIQGRKAERELLPDHYLGNVKLAGFKSKYSKYEQ